MWALCSKEVCGDKYTHGSWSSLKTANARRTVPLNAELRALLRACYKALNAGSIVLHPQADDRLVFTSPEGGELEYNNWRARHWLPLLKATAPDAKHPKRIPVTGTPHMLRHSYATALIQAGENAKTVQTLMGHHSVAFTMDQYADAWPEALSNAGEKAAQLLFRGSGSKTVAEADGDKSSAAQVSEFMAPPAGVEPTTYRLGVRFSPGRAFSSKSRRERKQQLTRASLLLSHARFCRDIRRTLERCGLGSASAASRPEQRGDEPGGAADGRDDEQDRDPAHSRALPVRRSYAASLALRFASSSFASLIRSRRNSARASTSRLVGSAVRANDPFIPG
jgi:hypothetical protein